MSTARRPRPAVLDWEHRGFLTWAFLAQYTAYGRFREALVRLVDGYRDGGQDFLVFLASRDTSLWDAHVESKIGGALAAPAGDYVKALRATAAEWGLTRLGAPPPARGPLREHDDELRPSLGELLLHEWCQESARAALGGDGPDPMTFWTLFHVGGSRPDVGEVVHVAEFVTHEDRDRRVRHIVRDEVTVPVVRVSIEDQWDCRQETHRTARARLLAEAKRQIDAELDRLAADAVAKGYRFKDTAPKRQFHHRWLFVRVALGKPYVQVADEHNDATGDAVVPATVERRVKEAAREIGEITL